MSGALGLVPNVGGKTGYLLVVSEADDAIFLRSPINLRTAKRCPATLHNFAIDSALISMSSQQSRLNKLLKLINGKNVPHTRAIESRQGCENDFVMMMTLNLLAEGRTTVIKTTAVEQIAELINSKPALASNVLAKVCTPALVVSHMLDLTPQHKLSDNWRRLWPA